MTTQQFLPTDSAATGKLLSLLNVHALALKKTNNNENESTPTSTEDEHTRTGLVDIFQFYDLPASLRQQWFNDDEFITLTVTAGRLTLADLADFIGLNPAYAFFYKLLAFSNVKITVAASEANNNEYIRIEGDVLKEDENQWNMLGLTFNNPTPLKSLKLQVNIGHIPGSLKKYYEVSVLAKLCLEEHKSLHVALHLPVGREGRWRLKLLPPGLDFNLTTLAQLIAGSDAFNKLPPAIKNLPAFNLEHLNIEFSPTGGANNTPKVYSVGFKLQTANTWNILPEDGSLLALKEIALSLQVNFDDFDNTSNSRNHSYQGAIHGTAHIGSFDITADIPLPATGVIALSATSTQALPSLGEFSALLGGNSVHQYLPEGLADSFACDLNNLRLLIDINNRRLEQFELDISAASQWPVWQEHLTIEQFALQLQLKRTTQQDTDQNAEHWQASGSVQGEAVIENTPVGVAITKPSDSPWKIRLTHPITLSGLDRINAMTNADLQAENNGALPSAIETGNQGSIVLRELELQLQKQTPKIPYLAFYIETNGELPIIDGLTLQDAACILQIQSPFNSQQRAVTGQIGGTLNMGRHPLTLTSLKNPNASGWTFTGKTRKGDEIPLNDALNALLGTVGVHLPNTLPTLAVKDINVSYTPSEKALSFSGTSLLDVSEDIKAMVTVDLDYNAKQGNDFNIKGNGQLTLGRKRFSVTAHHQPLENILNPQNRPLSGWHFSAQSYNEIAITELISGLLKGSGYTLPEALPITLSVSNVYFATTPKTHYLAFSGDAQMRLELRNFELDLGLHVNAERPAVRSISDSPQELQLEIDVNSQLTLAKNTPHSLDILLSGSYSSNQKGWLLTGQTAPGQTIAIGALMEDLMHKFAITPHLPKPLESLTLSDLSTSFNTANHDFTFRGRTQFEMNQTAVDMCADISIRHNQDGNSEKHIRGKLTLGETHPKVFDVMFDQTPNSQLMLGAYHSNEDTPVPIGDLLNPLLPADINITDSIRFSLHDAVLAYHGESNNRRVLFASHMGSGINLANLPLIGALFAKNKKLTLNYQILAASNEFGLDLLTRINPMLPDGISALGEQPISKGLHISATMIMDEEHIPFELPIALNNEQGASTPIKVESASSTPPSDDFKWHNLQKTFGPVYFNRIGVKYDNSELKFALDAKLTAGGLTLSLDGLAVSSPITHFDPHFDLKGIGVDLKKGPVEIGAAFLREHVGEPAPKGYDEYNGQALIKLSKISIDAIGSYAYVNDHPSLFIYAAVNQPLGGPAFFFVTGLSAAFGYNRSLRMPSIDTVLDFPLVSAALNGKALPPNAGKHELNQQLQAIHNYIPPDIGSSFLAFGVSFSTFKLIESTALLSASFGQRFEMDLLGVSTMTIPPFSTSKPLAMVQMTLKGSYVPEEGFLGLQGQLTPNSYVLSKDCHLTGGFAFYSWFDGEHKGDFVTTIGGYHPHFNKPKHYPSVPQVGLNWQVDQHTRIKGGGYFALCPHAIMAGGNLQANYHNGNLKAWFNADADFLMAWSPYHYEAKIHVNIGGSYTYHLWGSHTMSVDVGSKVHIWGPEFGGKAKVDLWITSLDVEFGEQSNHTQPALSWNEFNQSFLPTKNQCQINLSQGQVSKGENDKSLGIVNAKELVISTDSVVPITHIESGITKGDDKTWRTNLGIAPMGKSSMSSQMVLRINKVTGTGSHGYDQLFKYQAITKKVPAALWGKNQSPEVNGVQFIDNALTGIEIRPDVAPELGAVAMIDTSRLDFENDISHNAIVWGASNPFSALNSADNERRNKLRESIQSDNAKVRRAAILSALNTEGFFDIQADIPSNLDQGFVIAPQIAA